MGNILRRHDIAPAPKRSQTTTWSEFINHTVAKLLNKLLVEQTKSRPRHSNDNGLVEAKNGAVIHKHMGYGHIASAHAAAIEAFYERLTVQECSLEAAGITV